MELLGTGVLVDKTLLELRGVLFEGCRAQIVLLLPIITALLNVCLFFTAEQSSLNL